MKHSAAGKKNTAKLNHYTKRIFNPVPQASWPSVWQRGFGKGFAIDFSERGNLPYYFFSRAFSKVRFFTLYFLH